METFPESERQKLHQLINQQTEVIKTVLLQHFKDGFFAIHEVVYRVRAELGTIADQMDRVGLDPKYVDEDREFDPLFSHVTQVLENMRCDHQHLLFHMTIEGMLSFPWLAFFHRDLIDRQRWYAHLALGFADYLIGDGPFAGRYAESSKSIRERDQRDSDYIRQRVQQRWGDRISTDRFPEVIARSRRKSHLVLIKSDKPGS